MAAKTKPEAKSLTLQTTKFQDRYLNSLLKKSSIGSIREAVERFQIPLEEDGWGNPCLTKANCSTLISRLVQLNKPDSKKAAEARRLSHEVNGTKPEIDCAREYSLKKHLPPLIGDDSDSKGEISRWNVLRHWDQKGWKDDDEVPEEFQEEAEESRAYYSKIITKTDPKFWKNLRRVQGPMVGTLTTIGELFAGLQTGIYVLRILDI